MGLLVLVATRAVAAPGSGPPALDAGLDAGDGLDEDGLDDDDDLDDRDVDEASAEPTQTMTEVDTADAVDLARVLDDPDLDGEPELRTLIETGSLVGAPVVDAAVLADVGLRHQRPSRWGRLDLSIAWRRTWTPQPVTISLGPLPHGPFAQTYDTADTVLVVATWRR